MKTINIKNFKTVLLLLKIYYFYKDLLLKKRNCLNCRFEIINHSMKTYLYNWEID